MRQECTLAEFTAIEIRDQIISTALAKYPKLMPWLLFNKQTRGVPQYDKSRQGSAKPKEGAAGRGQRMLP